MERFHKMTKFVCQTCKPNKPCGGRYVYRVYVIELNTDVTNEEEFRDRNPEPERDSDKKCLYVGQTAHSIECRFQQHNRSVDPNVKGFECSCFGEPETRYFVNRHPTGSTRGHQFARYNLQLVFDLPHQEDNDFPTIETSYKCRKEAEDVELALATYLRVKGFGVWQN